MLTLNDYFNRIYLEEFFEQIDRNGVLLDLGCGKLPYSGFYESGFDHVVRADIEQRTDQLDVLASLEKLPFADNSADAILLSEVIEHVPDDRQAFREMSRVLAPGGFLILTAPFMYRMHEMPFDFRRYTEIGLRQQLEDTNFEIVCLRRRGGLLSLLATLTGQLFHGFMSSLTQIPAIGILFRPLLWAAERLLEVAFRLIVVATKRRPALSPEEAGARLGGLGGFLAAWTLGYCLLARKAKAN